MNIIYPESGFGNIVGQILEQKLKKPEKTELARKMRGEVVIEVKDFRASATIKFMGDSIEVVNGKTENTCSTISANFKVINELVSGATTPKVLKLILTRKLKIKGIAMARKLSALLA